MYPADAEAAFLAYATDRGVNLHRCLVREGFEQMIAFKRDEAAEGVEADDGDILLYQWGTFDWDGTPHFEISLTRQFVEANVPEDDAMSQLALTFRFAANPQYDHLGEGTEWFEDDTTLQDAEAFVRSHPAFVAVDSAAPLDIVVKHEYI
jgi:hypothetical protein